MAEGIKEVEDQQGGAIASTLLLWLCVHPLNCRWSHQHRWAVTSFHLRQRAHGSAGGGGTGEEQREKGWRGVACRITGEFTEVV